MHASTRTPTKHTSAFLAALVLCFLPGCYERVSHGNESVYQFAWWLGPLVIAGGILAFPCGWLLRKWSKKLGTILMILAPLMLIVAAPAIYSDYAIVDDDHFEARYGFWFAPTVHNLRFDDLQEIRYVAVPGSRGRTNYELHCISRTGQQTVVHAGDLIKNTVPEILERARKHGVRVSQ